MNPPNGYESVDPSLLRGKEGEDAVVSKVSILRYWSEKSRTHIKVWFLGPSKQELGTRSVETGQDFCLG